MAAAVLERLPLPDGRVLVVRDAREDDRDGLDALYRSLSVDDRRRRFFTGATPGRGFAAQWIGTALQGGVLVVAEVEHEPGIVAEAGCNILPNGNGELAMTIAAEWRGWLGIYLLDVVRRAAADRGLANLEADVLVDNCVMRSLLRHIGAAVVDHPDYTVLRLAISTTGSLPGWPTHHDARRVLVEGTSRWRGETAARAAGIEVLSCPGPAQAHCPLLDGEPCPMLDGADAIVVVDRGPPSRTMVARAGARRTDTPVVFDDGQEPIADVLDELGAEPPEPAPTDPRRPG